MELPDKAELRQSLKLQRRGIREETATEVSHAIIKGRLHAMDWEHTTSLHTYVPITARKEIDTWPLLEYVWRHHPQVTTAVPVVQNDEMRSIRVHRDTRWQENTLGIPEPQNGIPLAMNYLFDVVIVPVLGFDRRGHRLGYGKGHYDRFLRSQPGALTIGLAYATAEIADMIPAEPHDVPLNVVITEQTTYDFRRQTS
jgi:5-formyltetrahydrofolate cyclo-ligase